MDELSGGTFTITNGVFARFYRRLLSMRRKAAFSACMQFSSGRSPSMVRLLFVPRCMWRCPMTIGLLTVNSRLNFCSIERTGVIRLV